MAASEQRSHNRSRLNRRELKAPDEFLTITGRVLRVAGEHLRTISLVIGLVIVSIAVIWGARSYLRGLEQAAFVRLAYIEAQLRGTGNAQEVPATLIDELQDLTRQWGIGEAQGYAWLSLGHLHYRLGDYIMAATTYRQAQAATQPTRLLWSLATLGAAYALEGSGEWQRAQEAYQRLIDTQQAGFLLEAYYGKGRALERGNDLDGAIAAYAVVVERYPASAQTLGIADKIETLQARRD